MRLTHGAWQQFRPLFPVGARVEFDYHGRHRVGELDTIGEGPQGAFLTIRHSDGVFKSYSLAKVNDLRCGTRGQGVETTHETSRSADAAKSRA